MNKVKKAKTEVKKIVEKKIIKLPAKKGTSKFRRCIELLEQRKFTDEHIFIVNGYLKCHNK